MQIPEIIGKSYPFTFFIITVSLGYFLSSLATSNSLESSVVISIMFSSLISIIIPYMLIFLFFNFSKSSKRTGLLIESISPLKTAALRPLLTPTVATGTPGGIFTVESR